MRQMHVLKARREGGAVERGHIVPHATSYTNGHHSYNVAQIIRTYHPCPSLALVGEALDHDVVERWMGDTPATSKWMYPPLRAALSDLEGKLEDKFGFGEFLTKSERLWLKSADLLEIWMWANDQIYLGNRNAEGVNKNVFQYLEEMGGARAYFPGELFDLYNSWTPDRLQDKLDLGNTNDL